MLVSFCGPYPMARSSGGDAVATFLVSMMASLGSSTAVAGTATAATAAGSAAAVSALPAVTGSLVAAEFGSAAVSSSIFAGITAADVISGTLSAFSALTSIRSSQAAAAALQSEARLSGVEAGQIQNQALQDRVSIRERLNDIIAANVVDAFASGITPTGSVEALNAEARRIADFELGARAREAAIQTEVTKLKGGVSLSRAANVRTAGTLDALTRVGSFFERRERRGRLETL
jgi:hypothetical protein